MRPVYLTWFILLIFKLILGLLIPLSPDESYYWVWSHNLQLSYFDHPAAISWLISLGHFLENFLHAVRWPSILLFHFGLLFWTDLLKRYFFLSNKQIILFLLVSFAVPLTGLGSIILTPDIPLFFFSTAAFYFLIRILHHHKISDYVFLGASLGLGFCSKYHIVLFPITCFLLLFIKDFRNRINYKYLMLTILFGFLFSLPVLVWNLQNDFVSFKFQITHGLGKAKWEPEWTRDYILGQLVLMFPALFFALKKPKALDSLFLVLVAFAVTPLIFFFFTSFRGHVEANWPVSSYPFLVALLVLHINRAKETFAKVHLLLWGSLSLIISIHAITPIVDGSNSKIDEPRILRQLATEVASFNPLYASTYQIASSLSYNLKRPINKLFQSSRFDFYDLTQKQPTVDKVFYLLKNKHTEYPEWLTAENPIFHTEKTFDHDMVLIRVQRP